MTPVERYHQRLRENGCIACIMLGNGRGVPGAIHHLFDAHERDDWLVVCLCDPGHHKGHPRVVGFHPGGERRFRHAYGFGEKEMLARSIAEYVRGGW